MSAQELGRRELLGRGAGVAALAVVGAVPLALLSRIEPEAPPEEVKRLRRRVLSTRAKSPGTFMILQSAGGLLIGSPSAISAASTGPMLEDPTGRNRAGHQGR
jgi:hypothetical protein